MAFIQALFYRKRDRYRSFQRRSGLKSGGYLIIEQTEALSVIDVNSGKNVAKAKSMEAIEASALKTNLEAADKLCQQIKVRNLSGIIIVDFINMNQRNCDILMEHLKSLAKNGYSKHYNR